MTTTTLTKGSNKIRPAEQMAHDLVKAHRAKHAYSITLKFPADNYFQRVGKAIVKFYQKELSEGE